MVLLVAESAPVTDPAARAAPCKGSRVRDHYLLKNVTMFWKTMQDRGAVGPSSKIVCPWVVSFTSRNKLNL